MKKGADETEEAMIVDDFLHSAVDIDQAIVLIAETLALSADDSGFVNCEREKLERIRDFALKSGELLRMARRELNLKKFA